MSEYIKFTCESHRCGTEIAPFDGFAELNAYRRKLLQLRLIGVDANGIGFGNLSVRDGATNNYWFGDRRNTRTDAGGLRTSGGLRFQKELAPV